MTKDKPLILVTNDDGVGASGLRALTACMKDMGEVVVVAPDGPRSGMSAAVTSVMPVIPTLLSEEGGVKTYSCSGTPADCVKLASNVLLARQPALVVSGINHGGNMAVCVHYSGTVGAVIEGCILGIPSVAVSLADYCCGQTDGFDECCRLARQVVGNVLKFGLPKGTYLNLNVPNVPQVKGIRVCRQADSRFINEYLRSENADGKAVYWMTGSLFSHPPSHPDNDTQALDNGYASLVPCKIDVTDYDYIDQLKSIL